MADFFDDLDRLTPLAREALAKIRQIVGDERASIHARTHVVGLLIQNALEISRVLTPEGMVDAKLRGLGKR